jgi:hypothetical protein
LVLLKLLTAGKSYEYALVRVPHVMQFAWSTPSITITAVLRIPIPFTEEHTIDESEVHRDLMHTDDEM